MDKRAAILERLADFVLAEGLDAATLRAMAVAAGQSDRMLLYYFEDKDEILSYVIALLAERTKQALDAQRCQGKLGKAALHAELDRVVLQEALWPFLRLRLELAARAAHGDGIIVPLALRFGEAFHNWIEEQLSVSDAIQRRQDATEIMIGLEGVILLKAQGMQDRVQELL